MTATLVAAEYGAEFADLRGARRARVLAEMERRDVDALVLCRIGNGKYISGHRGLWRAVLGSFAPMVVLIRSTGAIHLAAATWDDGIPVEIPHENLTKLTWNPREAISGLVRAEGLKECRRIAADGMSTGIAGLLEMLAPGVELVDGEELMRAVRRVKLPAEIDVIRTAIAIAEGSLATAVDLLTPGVSERTVQGAFMQALTSYGLTVPALEGTFRVLDGAPPQPGASARVMGAGESFVISSGVIYAGYEADVVLTHRAAGSTDRAALDRLMAACRQGAMASDLLAAAPAGPQPGPVIVGLGMGVEPPIVGGPGGLQELYDEPLEAGMVLGLQTWADGTLVGDMVLVTDGEPVRLTRWRTD